MPLELPLHVVGVSHHTAGVRVREHLVLTPDDAAAWLQRQRLAGRSAAILSTCNRFEIYWSGGDDLEPWFREFAGARGIDLGTVLTRLDGAAAARHLFSVAAGLDSQILGETEILGQVRRAHQTAHTAGTSTRQLDASFCAAIAAGRRVRRETALGKHPASVSSAAVEVALDALPQGNSATAVVLGAGEVADGVMRALVERGVTRVTLVNRRAERASALASKWMVRTGAWEDFRALVACADLLFVTTGAKHHIVRATDLADTTAARASELVVLDLAVPRNVEPSARKLPGVRLFNLDDLQQLRCPAAGQPSIAVAEAERILAEELARLEESLRARAAAPQLAELHRLGSELAREEADRALASLDRLSDLERQVVREMAERLVRRVLYPVSRNLRVDDERTA
ncbi:MAG: glutamyl-tRNA reductase [Gemmatimonadales bacterium]|nr:glutamyl-tRNA reductase [Gemmatimonadales bacterium]